ncbi:aminoacyl-tRNA hydrolase [Treponema pectinovorum]|uniref:aminoacyl-tRNA hydrolase n=1 Tax=Treponema pectinovorum TaxID=164 RepID=UPI0011CAFFCA|nr:aminoacyl-tRNA hydrolase [Treponema pectinovorum]
MIKLVAFLGNYGLEYEKTRHNVAWQFARELPFYDRLNWQTKFKGEYAAVETEKLAEYFAQTGMYAKKDGTAPLVPQNAPEKIYFLKPFTYMNLSGESVLELAHFFKIDAKEILVVHDELELPLGTVSLKWSGGLGGHNGLRSMKACFGTADFWRLRFGLTKPLNRDIADYVLSPFSNDEQEVLSQTFSATNELFAKFLLSTEENQQRLLQVWNKKKIV